MANTRALLLSHTIIFVAGFAAGKFIDYSELKTYRELHEGTSGKIRRWAGNIALGALAVGTLLVSFRITRNEKTLTAE
jgi:hypothetical protein